MAITTKVITMRQGNAADYQATNMKSGELAVINDTAELRFAYADGQDKRVATEDDISQLSEQIGDMDSGLPEVTTADNGKVLQVVDGVWGAVEVVDGNTVLFYADGNEVAY